MSWSIQSISPAKESVFLLQAGTGVTRQISVPGALDASFEGGMLVIKASTGCVWKVDPDTGARKRICRDSLKDKGHEFSLMPLPTKGGVPMSARTLATNKA